MQWAETGALLVGGLSLIKILDGDYPFSKAYVHEPLLFALMIVGFAAYLYCVVKLRKGKDAPEFQEEDAMFRVNKLEQARKAFYRDMGVPINAAEVDVLYVDYDAVDGEPVLKKDRKGVLQSITQTYKAFSDSENLYLADFDGKFAFPLSAMKGIRTIDCKGETFWEKTEKFDPQKYEQFNVSEKSYKIEFEGGFVLDMEIDGDTWEVYFPCYELPVIEELTGLKA